jgi:hypothetical protein
MTYTYVSGMTINAGGTGKTIAGGTGILIRTFTSAVAGMGGTRINAKSNALEYSVSMMFVFLHFLM